MAFSDVDIVNAALASIRGGSITSTGDDSEEARLASTKLRFAKIRLLGEADWVCATRTVNLVRTTEVSPFADSLQYAYSLPTDSIRVLSILLNQNRYDMGNKYYGRGMEPSERAFVIEGSTLYTSADTCQIVYVKEISTAEYSRYLFIPLISLLASEMTYSLANSANYADQLYKKYVKELGEAVFSNSMESEYPSSYGRSTSGRAL